MLSVNYSVFSNRNKNSTGTCDYWYAEHSD